MLLTVAGGTSHLYPIVPLAWAFRAAGHEVRLGGKPQAIETMTHTGLPMVVLGGSSGVPPEAKQEVASLNYGQRQWAPDWPARPASLDPEQTTLLEVLGRYTVAVAEGMVDDQVEFARHWRPDLIIHDTLALGAQVAGALTGVPTVRYTHCTQDVFQVEYRITDGAPLPEYTRMFDRFGLPTPTGTPNLVDTVPPSTYSGGERPCVEMRWVPYNGPGDTPAGLTGPRRRPRVCVTWGVTMASVYGPAAAEMYRTAIAAIAAAGAEVLVLSSPDQLAALGTPPDGVRHVARAPLSQVLPYCDVIMHHGGEGTAMAAASLAVPQLITTHEPFDDYVMRRLAATGAAICFRYQDLAEDPAGTTQISDSIEQLLSEPGYAAAAGRLRDEIERQPSPAEVVPVLAALCGSGRGSGS